MNRPKKNPYQELQNWSMTIFLVGFFQLAADFGTYCAQNFALVNKQKDKTRQALKAIDPNLLTEKQYTPDLEVEKDGVFVKTRDVSDKIYTVLDSIETSKDAIDVLKTNKRLGW